MGGFGDVLRGLGSVLNPQVAQGLEQERMQGQQQAAQQQQFMLGQLVKGVESGAIDPAKLPPQLQGLINVNPAVAREAKMRQAFDALSPEDRQNPAKVKSLFLQYAEPKDALAALSKNPFEGLPDIAKLQQLEAQYRAGGRADLADQIAAQIKKNSQTEGSQTQEMMAHLLEVKRKIQAGEEVSDADLQKASLNYRFLNTPKTLADGTTVQPSLGRGFDPEQNFGIAAPGDTSYKFQTPNGIVQGSAPNVNAALGTVGLTEASPQTAGNRPVVQLPGDRGTITPPPQGPNLDLGKPAHTEIDKELMAVTDRQRRISSIQSGFKPEYQKLQTRWSTLITDAKDKIGFEPDAADRKELEDYSKFRMNAISNLSLYIKEITGAAMGIQEAERIMKGMPNPGQGLFDGDGPTQFKAKMDEVIKQTKMAEARLVYMKRNGMSVFNQNGEPLVSLEQMPKIMNDRGAALEAALRANSPKASDRDIQKQVRSKLADEFGLAQ